MGQVNHLMMQLSQTVYACTGVTQFQNEVLYAYYSVFQSLVYQCVTVCETVTDVILHYYYMFQKTLH